MKRIAIFVAALFWSLPVWAAVEIQELTSPGGIDAWLVEEHSIPFTAIEIRFRGGAVLDAPDKRGAVNLMVGLLEEGTGDLDAQGFAAAREALAASYEYRAYDDVIAISARFLTENRAAAVDLLRRSVAEPRFDQVALDRVREQVLSAIRSDATDPSSIAGSAFDAMAWAGHPYASDRDGTIETVTSLTREDMIAAHAAVFARDRMFVSAVGDITAEELGVLLDGLLGGLPATSAVTAPMANYQLTGGITLIPFDTPQSVALFGHAGIKRDDPDYMIAYVLNEIVGGSDFESRLTAEVREKRGLTYGIGTFLSPMEYGELLIGQVRSDNARMAETIEVIRSEWRRVAAEGVTQAELDAAKTYLTGAYALRFDGNAPIARILVGMQMTPLPVSYLEERNALIDAITPEDIARVAARLYRPDDLRFVVVGAPEGVTATD